MSSNINHPYPDQYPPSFCSYVLNYSNCKCANWVLQAFLRPSLVPKCDIYCLKNKCCYTYSNSILVTLSHTYVIYLTWTIRKLLHARIKHKDFIYYIVPSPNYLSNHIDLSQLSSSIRISQIMILYHILHVITPQWINFLNKHLSIVWFVWSCLYGVFMLYYFLCYSVAKNYVLSWEKWKDRIPQKGKWHTCSLPTLLMQ
jgi:hypothetical protein